MQPKPFGATPAGEPVQLWTWANAGGARIAVSEMGATLVRLETPDRNKRLDDVTLGFTDAEAYAANELYAGAVVGRFANRIAGARFMLAGQRYVLTANSGPHCLHGGTPGLHQKRWRAEPIADGSGLRLRVTSPAGEAGFPGEMQARADYQWSDDHTLTLTLCATVDAPCPISLAPHWYWNLNGHGEGSILSHWLQVQADAFTPVGADLIPDGRLAPAGADLDYRTPKPLRETAESRGGLDHNFVLRGEGLRPVARLWSPQSGRRLTLSADRPGLQIYTLNACPLSLQGVKDGRAYRPHSGVALEPQAYPDSPNQPAFPTTILNPGQVFTAVSIIAFDVADSLDAP
jgi:aldose 1-epimerase